MGEFYAGTKNPKSTAPLAREIRNPKHEIRNKFKGPKGGNDQNKAGRLPFWILL
jgi:hypothetical protein